MSLIMPAFAAVILIYGLIKRVPVFDTFLEGAREGFLTLWQIAPTILGLLFAVSLLRTGGATEVLCRLLSPVAQAVGFPAEVVPMAMLRPVSGSGATALLLSVFRDCGPDSFAGRVASVRAGSSETTLCAVTRSSGRVGIRNVRHTLLAAIAADLTAMVLSAVTTRLFLG